MKPPARGRAAGDPRLHGGLLLLLLAAEFLLFRGYLAERQAWVFPRWNDQIQYLTESYTSHLAAVEHGWWAGLRESVLNPAAQGTLHDVLAVLLFSVAGPSRLSALTLNVLAFLAWQAATFVAWRRLTRSWSVAWCGAGLLLCLNILVDTGPGSTVDFRLDWLACCGLGLVAATGLATDGLRRPGWSAVWGAVIGLTIVARFLTLAYLGVMAALLLLGLAARWALRRDRDDGRRLGHLFLAGAVAAAVALPLLWHNRDWVINYYWVGHLTGPESAIRSPNFGLGRSLGAVFRDWLWAHNLGRAFQVAGAAALVAVAAAAAWRRREPDRPEGGGADLRWAFALGALLLAVPGAILTLHSQKSPFVVSAATPGAVALTLAAFAALARRSPRLVRGAAAAGVLATGVWHFHRAMRHDPHPAPFAADARRVNLLADYLFEAAQANRLEGPYIGVDHIADWCDGLILRVVCFERHGVWLPFRSTIPTGIAEDREDLIRERVAQSDFVFLTDEPGFEGYWPSDRQLRRLHPELKAWCEANRVKVATFRLFDRRMSLYRRAELRGPDLAGRLAAP